MKNTSLLASALAVQLITLSACGGTVIEPGKSAGTGGSGGTSATSTTTATTSNTTSKSTTSTTSTTSMTSTTSSASSPCSAAPCGSDQLCVVPACQLVAGELCVFGEMDAGNSCPPGTVYSPQFNLDCLQPGFACETGCPAPPPFCVSLPASCNGAPTCACLASDPCLPSNSGACHDEDIAGAVLTCSLKL